MNRRWIVVGATVLALGILIIPAVLNRSAGPRPVTGKTAADSGVCDPKAKSASLDFTLKDMHGADVKLADHKGKVILLDFWATWCGPCKYEIPGFVELQTKYRSEGLVVLGVSVDDPVEKLKPFADQFKMNYSVLVGRGRDDVEDAFGPIWGIPTTLVISRDGKICKRHTGMSTKDQFEREIKALL